MSYGKKDEDADLGLVKVDRTQVFQEGNNSTANAPASPHLTPTSIPHRLPLGKVAKLQAKLGGTQLDCSTALRSSLDDAAFS